MWLWERVIHCLRSLLAPATESDNPIFLFWRYVTVRPRLGTGSKNPLMHR
jgi:hypothetical protein